MTQYQARKPGLCWGSGGLALNRGNAWLRGKQNKNRYLRRPRRDRQAVKITRLEQGCPACGLSPEDATACSPPGAGGVPPGANQPHVLLLATR
jgi:hypothetical protein